MDLLKERTGSIGAFLMLQLLIYSIFVGIIASSTIDLQSSYFSGLSAGRVELEAQQWAEIKANTVRLIGYDDITNQSRQSIDGSNGRWEDEVIVDEAVQIGPDEDNKQKIVTIKVYNPSDITSKFDLKVPLSSQGNTGSVPIGTIIIWPVSNMPDNKSGIWLECNGQSCEAYPKLVAVLKSNYVPDYQGIFLRGDGSQYSYHYGTVLHSSAAIGTLQGDTIRNIYGNMQGSHSGVVGIWDSGNGAFNTFSSGRRSVAPTDDYFSFVSTGMSFNSSRVVPTANENRPINKAVKYLIKAH